MCCAKSVKRLSLNVLQNKGTSLLSTKQTNTNFKLISLSFHLNSPHNTKMTSPSLYSLLTLIFLFTISSAQTTTLTLSPSTLAPPLSNPWQRLNYLVTSSTTRAHHLKHPKKTNITTTKVPLYPRGYGGYSISLSFGTPPQTIPFVLDTGSSLVWSPCTSRYACLSCNFVNIDPSKIPTFIPRKSSSARIIGCKNPKCKWLFPNVKCDDIDPNPNTTACPPYVIHYGSGSTTGLLLSESLDFPKKTVKNFLVGCSIFSNRQPSGIAGFGRGPTSLPTQMGLKRFAYCLVSHQFDEKPVKSDLILVHGGAASGKRSHGINYTPFRKNPTLSNSVFQEYYYVTLRKVMVGGIKIKAPYKYLVPNSDGNGGTIVDSGTTFTFMEDELFDLVAAEFVKQVGGNYSRAGEVERLSGLKPCFNVSGEEVINLPKLVFHFKGGAEMELPLIDYFSFLDDSVICMTIVKSGNGGGVGPGPAIVLGNYQQQNFYIEYDLENNRFGFRKKLCR